MITFFEEFPIQELKFENLQAWTNESGAKILFLWGESCPNCEIAKRVLTDYLAQVEHWKKNFGINWYHASVYENFEWAHHFGLKGIPHFMVYKDSRKIGKISPFPGWEPFKEAIEKAFSIDSKDESAI